MFVFDLDGTLSDTSHRLHFLEESPKNWDGYYAACGEDGPIWPMIHIFWALKNFGHRLEIWTGRSEVTRGDTLDWLDRYGIEFDDLKMRGATDKRPDTVLKAEWLKASNLKPKFVFEDRARMTRMYRDAGIPCAQVADGDF